MMVVVVVIILIILINNNNNKQIRNQWLLFCQELEIFQLITLGPPPQPHHMNPAHHYQLPGTVTQKCSSNVDQYLEP